jgi:ABC-2 type transport system permease protein
MTAPLVPGAVPPVPPVLPVGGPTSAAGSIYDLGYRGYDGPRLGRRHAVATLVRESLRTTFGIGRGGRAKIIPFGLAFLALLPALVAVAVAGLRSQIPLGDGAGGGDLSPVRYDTYYGLVAQLLFMFAAAQAPELLGRDLRYSFVSLIFARALRRTDYVAARAAALALAIAAIQLVPQALIFAGRVLASADVVAAAGDDLPSLPPVLVQAALAAVLLAALALAVASFSARRSYATAAIIVAFILPPLVSGLLRGLAGSPSAARLIGLVSPSDLLQSTNDWLFGLGGPTRVTGGGPAAAAAVVAITLVALAVLALRYRRLAA